MAPKVLKVLNGQKVPNFIFPLLRVFLYIGSTDSMQVDQKESTESESNSSGDEDFDPGNDNNEDSDDEDDGNASDHEVAVPDSSTLARKRVKHRHTQKGSSTLSRIVIF